MGIAKHNKSYASHEEYLMRYERWLLAEIYIVKNNADPKSTHTAGHNFMSDFTEEELKNAKKLKIFFK